MIYRIKFSVVFFVSLQVIDLIAIAPMGTEAVKLFTKGIDELASKHIPPILEASENFNETAKILLPAITQASPEFGAKFGYETIKFLFEKCEAYAAYGVACGNEVIVFAGKGLTTCAAGATKAAAAIKSGAAVIAPATPYVIGFVCVVGGGYVCYKVYCYYNPSTGEQIIATEEELKLYKLQVEANQAKVEANQAKVEANQAKVEVNKSKIDLYKSKVDRIEAKQEMMVKMTAKIAASSATT